MSGRFTAAIAAFVFAVIGVVSAVNRDNHLFMLGMIAAGIWLIVSYLSPIKQPTHEHTWDWTPHPVTGLSAATCTTCGEKAVFDARR